MLLWFLLVFLNVFTKFFQQGCPTTSFVIALYPKTKCFFFSANN